MDLEVLKKKPVLDRLLYWIVEREAIRKKKESGAPRPWTSDPILQSYRFCNVRREDDHVTKWFADNWRTKWADHEDLWFASVVARLFNKEETLGPIESHTLPFTVDGMRGVLNILKRTEKIFNPAYIVSTNGHAMDKVTYLMERVLTPLWKAREFVRPTINDNLASVHERMLRYDGLGKFMAAQVIADIKYVQPLDDCDDWDTFAASGPGSRRGMNRLLGKEPDASIPEKVWAAHLETFRDVVNLSLDWNEPIHAQDFQNCLCEFDKYERALGGKRPKQNYRPRLVINGGKPASPVPSPALPRWRPRRPKQVP
jgi:hypothetical protein